MCHVVVHVVCVTYMWRERDRDRDRDRERGVRGVGKECREGDERIAAGLAGRPERCFSFV